MLYDLPILDPYILLWPGVVVPVRILSMDKIELFNLLLEVIFN